MWFWGLLSVSICGLFCFVVKSEQWHISILCSSCFISNRLNVYYRLGLVIKKLTLILPSLSSCFLVVCDSCKEVVA